jgi:hypothetical protein
MRKEAEWQVALWVGEPGVAELERPVPSCIDEPISCQ